MAIVLDQHKELFTQAIEHLQKEIGSLRTGRATPALVEDVMVEAYGSRQPLKHVSSISVSDAKTLVVEPWDKGLIQAVDKAIRESSTGINPVNDGKVIRLPLPDLTTERRQELLKVLSQKLEDARISLRQAREEARKKIDAGEKAKEISEDEKFSLYDALDRMVKEFNDKVKEVGEKKEKEIVTV